MNCFSGLPEDDYFKAISEYLILHFDSDGGVLGYEELDINELLLL